MTLALRLVYVNIKQLPALRSTSKRKMAAANAAAAAARRLKVGTPVLKIGNVSFFTAYFVEWPISIRGIKAIGNGNVCIFQHNSGAAGRTKNSFASDDLRRAASIGCLSQQQQQTVAVVAAAGVDPASVSPVGAGAIPDFVDGQFRSRTLSHGSTGAAARPIAAATAPFRTRTYSNASSTCGGEINGPSPPLTDFTLPAQSVLTPPSSSSNATMDSPVYREDERSTRFWLGYLLSIWSDQDFIRKCCLSHQIQLHIYN